MSRGTIGTFRSNQIGRLLSLTFSVIFCGPNVKERIKRMTDTANMDNDTTSSFLSRVLISFAPLFVSGHIVRPVIKLKISGHTAMLTTVCPDYISRKSRHKPYTRELK